MPEPPPADRLTTRFRTRLHVLRVADRDITLLAPEDPDALLDDPDVQRRTKADDYMPYWPIIWPSSLMLAAQILTADTAPPDLPQTPPADPLPAALDPVPPLPRAIELGCGLGLAGLAAGLRGWHITLTDYDPEAVEFAHHNALRNGVPLERLRAVAMDWRQPVADLFDWVIASDVLYERRLHAPLLGAIRALLATGGTAWISDPQRTSAEDFPLAAVEAGFRCASINLEGKNFHGGVQPGTLHVLTWPKRPAPRP
jgi:SAM-dependent methyltransferase